MYRLTKNYRNTPILSLVILHLLLWRSTFACMFSSPLGLWLPLWADVWGWGTDYAWLSLPPQSSSHSTPNKTDNHLRLVSRDIKLWQWYVPVSVSYVNIAAGSVCTVGMEGWRGHAYYDSEIDRAQASCSTSSWEMLIQVHNHRIKLLCNYIGIVTDYK